MIKTKPLNTHHYQQPQTIPFHSTNKRCWIYVVVFIVILVLYVLLIVKFISKNHTIALHTVTSNRIEKIGGIYGSEKEVHETTKLLKAISHDIVELKDRSHGVLMENLSPSQYGRVVSFQQKIASSHSLSEGEYVHTVDLVPPVIELSSKDESTIETSKGLRESSLTEPSLEEKETRNELKPVSIVKPVDISSHPKFPSAIEFTNIPTDRMITEDEMAILIVGGTDGSGTRRVVQILTELGVKMVSEDPETFDIHADLVGGWPTIVKPVVKQMRSLDYDPALIASSHPREYKKSTDEFRRLLNQVDRDSHKPTSHRLAIGGVLPKPSNVEAKFIKYGFKAPVSMTLLPYWVHMLPHCKFVHVVRDGRDIAFSVNQGPVEKFYDDMYGRDTLQPPVKAIRLWSDWNSQIYDWSKKHADSLFRDPEIEKSRLSSFLRGSGGTTSYGASSQQNPTVKSSFSYIVMHTEDTVSESRAIRFSAIYHLAKFVGSTISIDQICCLAVENMEFMGSHDRSQVDRKNQQSQVSSRYGKWKKRTEKNPNLLDSLYSYGKVGLKTFGYDPVRELPDDAMITEDGYHCNFSPKDCNYEKKAKGEGSSEIKIEEYSFEGSCEITAGVDYKGGNRVNMLHFLAFYADISIDDLENVQFDIQDSGACCRYVSRLLYFDIRLSVLSE